MYISPRFLLLPAYDPQGENSATPLNSCEGYDRLRTLKKALDQVDQRPLATRQTTPTKSVVRRLKNCINCGI
ncbi:hypothetical protein TSMEX_011164 [Taenia solium]|eukprot:TsM_000750700 transcript=TsM_000750700 gene=TsM_000750700